MSTLFNHESDVVVSRQGMVRRRDFLRSVATAGLAAGACNWADLIKLQANELRKQGMACILLWMQGGPSQFETWSPKVGHENGGNTKAIKTNVPGIEISENLPETAKVMDDVCLIRTMNSKEGSHPRASYLMHTGYLPTAVIKYPTLGSIVAHEIGSREFDLPNFVRIGTNRGSDGGGFFGVEFDPFAISDPDRSPDNTTITTSSDRFRRRLGLLGKLEDEFAASGNKQEVEDHRKLYAKTSKMILSPRMDRFDIDQEPAQLREAYGKTNFGNGCLLARRLIEAGVTFVEVNAGNWDTHDDGFTKTKSLCKDVDQPYAALLRDLKQRGMLDKTLVLWMGEFGRTPKVNPRAGRDHYPKAFTIALAGGGVRGGQSIGATDKGGVDVTDRPVSVTDLFQTICRSLKIDTAKENMSSIGRPIKLVDGGEVVQEVFG